MNTKYLKNPKNREKFYPITKSDCIIDAFSINDLEIDKLFDDSLSVSKHLKGMSYLNLQGLIHYHSKIKDYINEMKDSITDIPEVLIYTAGENITIENNVISAVIPEVDLSGYATEVYVDLEIANIDIPSLDGYATELWVDDNYLKKHEYVDLGLPSGLLWATCNVGATKPEEYGDYFAWGETTTLSTYIWSTYKYCNGSSTSLTKYNTNSSYGTVDNKTTLDLSDDAARANWGGSWRMPTDVEWTELREQCTWTWTTQNGVNGYKVTSKSNGNNIFLPAAGWLYDSSLDDAGNDGYYWSSTLYTGGPFQACGLYFRSIDVRKIYNARPCGLLVRPVRESIPKLDSTKIKDDIVDRIDGVYYFTTDTKLIYRNGESYGGCITAEDVETLPEEGIHVLAVTFIKNYTANSNFEFTILPNYKYLFGLRTKLTINLDSNVNLNIVNHYLFEFSSGDIATTLTLPSNIKWTAKPAIKSNSTYLISIENNLGLIQEWE